MCDQCGIVCSSGNEFLVHKARQHAETNFLPEGKTNLCEQSKNMLNTNTTIRSHIPCENVKHRVFDGANDKNGIQEDEEYLNSENETLSGASTISSELLSETETESGGSSISV